jgi:hypothetical protein
MVGLILVASGLIAAGVGSWRGYVAARLALAPLVGEGDPTRRLIETARPLHARSRFRLAARQVLVAVLWLCVAMYGLYLLTVGLGTGA